MYLGLLNCTLKFGYSGKFYVMCLLCAIITKTKLIHITTWKNPVNITLSKISLIKKTNIVGFQFHEIIQNGQIRRGRKYIRDYP